MTEALKIEGLVKRYRGRLALDGLDLSVRTGSVLGLVGSNGAGKTTTLSILAGLLRANAGKVDILGDGPFNPSVHAGRVSLMPQDSDLPPETRLVDVLGYYAQLQGMPRTSVRDAVDDVIDWVNLSDRGLSTMRTLSHGMRRRVVIAQAFLGNPELILLDEPLSGLDPKEVVNVRNLLSSRKGRQTVVVSSHNLHEIQLICDRVAFIEKGRTVREDMMDTVVGRSHTVRYRVGDGELPVDALRAALPGVEFRFNREQNLLTCRSQDEDGAIARMNRTILQCLLNADVDILEMSQGSGLEEAYLGGTPGKQQRKKL